MKNFYLVMFVVSVTGCAPMKWNHPSNNQSDFYRDSLQCEDYARQTVRQTTSQTPRYAREPAYNTNCQSTNYGYTNNVQCRTERDTTYDRQEREYRQGQDLGNALFGGLAIRGKYADCMRSLGYVEE